MIRSEEGGAVWEDFVDFPPCPGCGERGRVGRNPSRKDDDEKTHHLPRWHCYQCGIYFPIKQAEVL